MVHVTCLAHGLHRTCEETREMHPAVNSLISHVKKVFCKALSRIQLFYSKLPTILLPPQPGITKSGSWLKAAFYYTNNYEDVRKIVCSLEPDDVACIRAAQNCFKVPTLKNELSYIKANFPFLVDPIAKLEGRFSLFDSVRIVRNVLVAVENVPSSQKK
ncbi:hypothetical protein ILUMI_16312 [Ignelater luminosus]|uniref:DUF659 domain-containing protein n=1 Tax=Ignelater luminosus TaxID=2038154 RepID=A0A8K0G8N9_IGNLU|nr:hypothetical protein ILUMI_16312 [Ignelater luminosus]